MLLGVWAPARPEMAGSLRPIVAQRSPVRCSSTARVHGERANTSVLGESRIIMQLASGYVFARERSSFNGKLRW